MVAAAVVALFTSLVAVRLLIAAGPRLGFVDAPDGSELKAHDTAAVPLGGVAVFLGVHVGFLVDGRWEPVLLTATAIVLVLGLADDRVGLPPSFRLAVSAGAGAILAIDVAGPWSSLLVAVLTVVAINAINLYDGLDGLAGSAALVSAVGLAVVAASGSEAPLGLVLAAALAGFLVFNWNPARAFLGDNGAYVVAVVLVWLIATVSSGPAMLLAGSGVLGVFIVDLAVTLLRRRRAGAPLFQGDRNHLYDRLHAAGISVRGVAWRSTALQLMLVSLIVAAVVLLPPLGAVTAAVVVGVAAVAILSFSSIVDRPRV